MGLEFVCVFGHDEVEMRVRTNDKIVPAWCRQTRD